MKLILLIFCRQAHRHEGIALTLLHLCAGVNIHQLLVSMIFHKTTVLTPIAHNTCSIHKLYTRDQNRFLGCSTNRVLPFTQGRLMPVAKPLSSLWINC